MYEPPRNNLYGLIVDLDKFRYMKNFFKGTHIIFA